MNIYSKPTDSKRNVSYLSNHPKSCLNPLSANPTKWLNTLKQFVENLPTNCLSVFDHFERVKNIPFCLAKRICMIVGNKNVRCTKLKELRTILKTQKYPKMVVEKEIEKALAIPQEQLRSEKMKKKDDILPFISTYLHIILIIQTCFQK